MIKTGLYVGSRHDIIPLVVFPNVQRWIYIDSLPVYEAGFEEDDYPPAKKQEMYLKDVESEMAKAGYHKESEVSKEKMILFQKGKREVYYFHSTFFPNVTAHQKKLMKDVTFLYLAAFTPDKVVLDMVCQTKPLTLLIWHAALFYNWENGGNSVVDFENGRSLTTYLMNHYVENVKYVLVHDTKATTSHGGIRQLIRKNLKLDVSSVKKIPCTNLLDYAYKEHKLDHHDYYKTLKDIPRVQLLNRTKKSKQN